MGSELRGINSWLAAHGRDRSGRGTGAFLLSPVALQGLYVSAGALWVTKKR
jgi:hypothetical protein